MEEIPIIYLEDYEDAEKENSKKKTRGKARTWVKLKHFEEASEAELYIKKESIWKITSRKHTSDGEKVEYRCKHGQYRKNECPVAIYLLYHSTDMTVTLYSTANQHHNHSTDMTVTLSPTANQHHNHNVIQTRGLKKENSFGLENDSGLEKENSKKKTRGKGRIWIKLKHFEDASEAELYIKKEAIWRITSRKQTLEGEKVEYRCKNGQYRINECPVAIYLLYHSTDMTVTLYSTENQHHNHNVILPRGLKKENSFNQHHNHNVILPKGLKKENSFGLEKDSGLEKKNSKMKTRGKGCTWIKLKHFKKASEAELYIKKESIWRITSRKHTLGGERVEYRCKNGKYRKNECPVAIYLLYHSNDTTVTLYSTANQRHNHNVILPRGLKKENSKKKTRGKGRIWIKLKHFEEASDAELYIKKESIWRITSRKHTIGGEKVEYRCKLGEYRKNECPVAIYLLYHSTDMTVTLYSTENQHHNHNGIQPRGLDDNYKIIITELFKNSVQKPNAILAAFRRKNIPEPPRSQVINFLRRLRNEELGQSMITDELINWCTAKKIPKDLDSLFVLDFKIDCISPNIDYEDVKIVLSTENLLENLNKSKMIQIDTTYKLIWQGYPVIIAGTSDKNKVFHPLAILVCKRENENDFAFLFAALKKHNVGWEPNILLADGSAAITNGFCKIFNQPIRLMCYFHMSQAVDKILKSIEYANDIKNDITMLQICNSVDIFNEASDLFLEKWYSIGNPNITDFLNYFKDEWLIKNKNWFEGAALGYPSTNNGLEAATGIIKNEHTIRELLPMDQFLNNLDNLLLKWSKDRNPLSKNFQKFYLEETLTLQDWIEAYKWVHSNKKILQVDDVNFYALSAKSKYQEITPQLFSQYTKKKWSTYDEFKELYFGIWVIKYENNKFVCSCPGYLKDYKCKHALGLEIQINKVEIPQQVKSICCVVKRKRERPSTARPSTSRAKKPRIIHK